MPFGFGGGDSSDEEKKKKKEQREEAEALEAKKKRQAARRQKLGKKDGDPDTDEEEEGKKPGQDFFRYAFHPSVMVLGVAGCSCFQRFWISVSHIISLMSPLRNSCC